MHHHTHPTLPRSLLDWVIPTCDTCSSSSQSAQCSTVVSVVRKGIGNGHFRGAAAEKPSTDWHKIWHGWLRRGCHSIAQMACQSVQGVTTTKGWNINGLCFFVCSLAHLGIKPLDQFWRVIYQNAFFWGVAFLWGLEQQRHNFRG